MTESLPSDFFVSLAELVTIAEAEGMSTSLPTPDTILKLLCGKLIPVTIDRTEPELSGNVEREKRVDSRVPRLNGHLESVGGSLERV